MSIRIRDRSRRVLALLIPALCMVFNLHGASASDPTSQKAAPGHIVAARYEIKGRHRTDSRINSQEDDIPRPLNYAVSLDGGTTWQAANSGLPPNGLVEIGSGQPAFDPSDADVQYICIQNSGYGVYKTSDGGKTWEKLANGLPSSDLNPPPGQLPVWGPTYVGISPHDTSTVYVGVIAIATGLRGPYKSTDAGRSFIHISTVPDGGSFAIDPQTPSTIYASVASGFIRSDDSGATWTLMNNGLPPTTWGVNGLAVDPQSKLYLGVGLARDAKGTGIYQSSDRGRHWTASETEMAVHDIVIDPLRPSVVYGLGQLGQPDDLAASDQGHGNPRRRTAQSLPLEGVIKSVDGGQTWAAVNGGLPSFAGAVYKLAIDPVNPDNLYLGTNTKVWKSSDGGQSWNSFGSGLIPVNVESLAVDPKTEGKVYASADEARFGPQVQAALVSGKQLTVTGQYFGQGTQIMVNGKLIPSWNDLQNPDSAVFSMKGGRKIQPGATVEVRVMDSDFTESNAYMFTRPPN